MRRFDRRSLAAFFFFALALSGCGGKRAMMERPPVGDELLRGEPSVEAGPAPQPPQEEERLPVEEQIPRTVILAETPRVRVLILESRQPVRLRITSAFRIGVDANDEPLATMDRGGDFT
ncbi:MAG: hypothetical protein NTW97_03860, partial [Candidatus Krumholzibacteria bacterium]|nr:hypothetical protein [Candidatus Krumholzibacteria bacterium]